MGTLCPVQPEQLHLVALPSGSWAGRSFSPLIAQTPTTTDCRVWGRKELRQQPFWTVTPPGHDEETAGDEIRGLRLFLSEMQAGEGSDCYHAYVLYFSLSILQSLTFIPLTNMN